MCARCGHELTSEDQRIEVGGLHEHSQVNPHGYIWNFLCFRDAPGCRAIGLPSDEFTWFPGCRWQLSHCGGCDLHNGWRFCGDHEFFGLIRERIAEQDS